MDEARIELEGIKELQAALRKVDKTLPREMAAGFAEGAQIIADAAKDRMPRVSGRAQDSIKPKKDQRGASLAVGGAKAPYFPWLDFGGSVGRNKATERRFLPGGRYIYPALAEKNEELLRKLDEVIERVTRMAGFTEQEGRA